MKLEDQVCSLDQAKKLVNLGVWIDSYFFYYVPNRQLGTYKGNWYLGHITPIGRCCRHESTGDEWIPAPNVAELGVLLPCDSLSIGRLWTISSSRTPDIFIVKMSSFSTKRQDKFFIDKTEAQARAAALIWLIENNFIDPKTITLK